MQKEVEMQQVRNEAENADRALHSLAAEKAELQSLVKSLDERLAEQETKSSGIAQRLDRVDVRLDDGAIVVLGFYQTVFHHDYVVR